MSNLEHHEYRVTYTAIVRATSFRNAAKAVQDMMTNPDTVPAQFQVVRMHDKAEKPVTLDKEA